jgi:hypothetical protein
MLRDAFKPGDMVPRTGAYWVNHYQHRVSHLAALKSGETFPECRKCGSRVRFEEEIGPRQAAPATDDPDFFSPENKKKEAAD